VVQLEEHDSKLAERGERRVGHSTFYDAKETKKDFRGGPRTAVSKRLYGGAAGNEDGEKS